MSFPHFKYHVSKTLLIYSMINATKYSIPKEGEKNHELMFLKRLCETMLFQC